MSATIPDLWRTKFVKTDNSPVRILREQARLLSQKTDHELEGGIHTTATGDGGFQHVFYIKAPSLHGYIYELFSVVHSVPFYPLRVMHPSLPGSTAEAGNQEEFLGLVDLVLNHPTTTEVVSSLLAQLPDSRS